MDPVAQQTWNVRKLSAADLEDCYLLSTEAGWNQTRSDWLFIIENSDAYGVEDKKGQVIATSVAFSLKETRWIAMVLVASDWRGRGLAGVLLKALGLGEPGGSPDYLDATKFGAPLYERRGFAGVGTIFRYQGEGRGPSPESDMIGAALKISENEDLAALVEGWEKEASVAVWCPKVLDYLVSVAPEHCLAFNKENDRAAIWVRPGRLAWEIGPLIASDTESAQRILDACLASLEGPVVIDVHGHETAFLRILEERGFSPVREFERMCCGIELSAEESGMTRYATAGPDFG